MQPLRRREVTPRCGIKEPGVRLSGHRQEKDSIRLFLSQQKAIQHELSQRPLQVGHLRGAQEALDLDGDLASRLLRGDRTLGAEIDIEAALAKLKRIRIVRNGPP